MGSIVGYIFIISVIAFSFWLIKKSGEK